VLKDGHEERFAIADYLAAGDEVLAALRVLRDDLGTSRPFLQAGCSGCYHDQRCLPDLQRRGDLSLVAGMSHGARAILEGVGCRTVHDLATFQPDGARARGHLDATLLRRLRRAAQAHLLGKPLIEERPRAERFDQAAIVHLLTDGFADRVLAIGLLHPARGGGAVTFALPRRAEDELDAFRRLVQPLPKATPLLHFGETLPRWHEAHAYAREAEPLLEARFVDLGKRLRSAAVLPQPVFGLADLVRCGLGRDPLRAGHAGAAAMWTGLPDGDERLLAKLRADLDDLAALKTAILDAAPTVLAETEVSPVAPQPAAHGTAATAD
jgi:predicted RecB family nuclease